MNVVLLICWPACLLEMPCGDWDSSGRRFGVGHGGFFFRSSIHGRSLVVPARGQQRPRLQGSSTSFSYGELSARAARRGAARWPSGLNITPCPPHSDVAEVEAKPAARRLHGRGRFPRQNQKDVQECRTHRRSDAGARTMQALSIRCDAPLGKQGTAMERCGAHFVGGIRGPPCRPRGLTCAPPGPPSGGRGFRGPLPSQQFLAPPLGPSPAGLQAAASVVLRAQDQSATARVPRPARPGINGPWPVMALKGALRWPRL